MKVVITDYEYPNIERERAIVEKAGFVLEGYHETAAADVLRVAGDADAIINQYADLNADVIAQLTNCKVIIKYGIGINNIDTEAATQHGICVCNIPDYGIDEVSNHAIAFLMGLGRHMANADKKMRQGVWGYESMKPVYRMAGKTLGIVGLGRIGSAVAKKMRGFDVKIIAHDPIKDKVGAVQDGIAFVDFETLCKQSDYISIHCPLDESSHHLFDAKAFEAMKPTAYLVNTARGPIIEEAALAKALQSGQIAGAGIDVYEVEPLPASSPLLGLDNVLLSSHSAFYSEQAIETLQEKAALEAVNVLQGNMPFHLCNTEVLQAAPRFKDIG